VASSPTARILSCCGDVAQLGERRVRNAKVGSSILLVSTITTSTGVSENPRKSEKP
jgi:hypothetical protein